MKIIVLQDYLRSGGTERHSILLAREFAALGHDSQLITFRPGGRLADMAGAARKSLQSFDTGIDWFAPGLLRTVLGGQPDIVLCMGKTANCYAGRIQRRAASRDLPTKVIGTLRAGGKILPLYYSSIKCAAHIVANSIAASNDLVNEHGVEKKMISVIHNSLVFPGSQWAIDQDLRTQLGAGPSTTVLLSVGMFRPEKNQRALLEMAAGLPKDWDWRLWLAGEGPEREKCEKKAAQLGLTDRVRFVGFMADPGPLYRAADVAVHASYEEALSNFLIEAQAHGLPAVACHALGIRECFIPGRTGWDVAQGDFDGFRACLALLAADSPEERSARSEEARAFARREFDSARQVGAYISLFEKLLGISKPVPPPPPPSP
jgi:glycosyltransferase involved in cell wall biosynthesis